MQLSAYYKHIDEPDSAICDNFKEELRKSPQKIIDQIREKSEFEQTVKELQKGRVKETKPEEPVHDEL